MCHLRSDTFRRNLSKIGSLQPAQWSLTPTDGSARPVNIGLPSYDGWHWIEMVQLLQNNINDGGERELEDVCMCNIARLVHCCLFEYSHETGTCCKSYRFYDTTMHPSPCNMEVNVEKVTHIHYLYSSCKTTQLFNRVLFLALDPLML